MVEAVGPGDTSLAGDDAGPDVAVLARDGADFGDTARDGTGEAASDEKALGEGLSETARTAAAGYSDAAGRCEPEAASAAPAAPAAITTLPAITALTGLTRHSLVRLRKGIRYTPVPCTVGGAPDGHSAASSNAASPRCELP